MTMTMSPPQFHGAGSVHKADHATHASGQHDCGEYEMYMMNEAGRRPGTYAGFVHVLDPSAVAPFDHKGFKVTWTKQTSTINLDTESFVSSSEVISDKVAIFGKVPDHAAAADAADAPPVSNLGYSAAPSADAAARSMVHLTESKRSWILINLGVDVKIVKVKINLNNRCVEGSVGVDLYGYSAAEFNDLDGLPEMRGLTCSAKAHAATLCTDAASTAEDRWADVDYGPKPATSAQIWELSSHLRAEEAAREGALPDITCQPPAKQGEQRFAHWRLEFGEAVKGLDGLQIELQVGAGPAPRACNRRFGVLGLGRKDCAMAKRGECPHCKTQCDSDTVTPVCDGREKLVLCGREGCCAALTEADPHFFLSGGMWWTVVQVDGRYPSRFTVHYAEALSHYKDDRSYGFPKHDHTYAVDDSGSASLLRDPETTAAVSSRGQSPARPVSSLGARIVLLSPEASREGNKRAQQAQLQKEAAFNLEQGRPVDAC